MSALFFCIFLSSASEEPWGNHPVVPSDQWGDERERGVAGASGVSQPVSGEKHVSSSWSQSFFDCVLHSRVIFLLASRTCRWRCAGAGSPGPGCWWFCVCLSLVSSHTTSDPTAPSQVLSTFLPNPNFRHFLPFFVLTSYLLHVVCFHRCQKNETNLWFKDINRFSFSLVFLFLFFYFLLCLFFLQIPPQPNFWAVRGSKLASCRPRAQSQFTPNRASGTDIKHTPRPLTPTPALWTPSDHLSFSCSWIEKNTPYYYSECARVVGPLLEQGVEKTKAAAVCISEKSVHFIHWVKETTPLVIDWVRTGQRCFNTGCHCPWCSLFVTECVCFFFPPLSRCSGEHQHSRQCVPGVGVSEGAAPAPPPQLHPPSSGLYQWAAAASLDQPTGLLQVSDSTALVSHAALTHFHLTATFDTILTN